MRVNDYNIVVNQSIDATLDKVWQSITEIDLMRQWNFENIPFFKPKVGFDSQFNAQSCGTWTYTVL